MRISTLISVRITFFFRFFLFLRIFVPFFSFPCFSQTPYDVFSCVPTATIVTVSSLFLLLLLPEISVAYLLCMRNNIGRESIERKTKKVYKSTNLTFHEFDNVDCNIPLVLTRNFSFFLLVRIYEEGMRYSVKNNITAWRHTVEDQRR